MPEMNPLTFSTVACPDWEIDRVIDVAGEYGYEGVELRTFGAGSTMLASDPALSDPEKIRHLFEKAGVRISCLATSVAFHYKQKRDVEPAMEAGRSFVDMAQRLGCPRIRTFGYLVYPGETRAAAVGRIAERYGKLADHAEEAGIEIVIENAGSFARAKELWQLTNLADHPLVGVCWNVANGITVGESPAVSVPALNARIRYAKLKDTEVGQGIGFVPLGEGTVGCERFVELLRGIGYEGWLCVEWDKAWLPALDDADKVLPQARETLIEWMRPKRDKRGKLLSRREAPSQESKAEE